MSMLRLFLRHQAGAIVPIFPIGLPVLLATVGATVEYASLAARRQHLQVAADSGALTGAREMTIAGSSSAQIQAAAVNLTTSLANTPADRTSNITATVLDSSNAVTVSIAETVPSMMGRLLTLPSTLISVTATAKLYGDKAPLCLLTLDGTHPDTMHLEQGSRLTANGCAIYNNSVDPRGLHTETGASATASIICTAGGYASNGSSLSPTPTTDCPAMKDPLSSRIGPVSSSCVSLSSTSGPGPSAAPGGPAAGQNVVGTNMTLSPGTYCGGLHITGSAQVTLASGTYIMKDGPLVVDGTSSLSGQYVGFYFTGQRGGLRFDPNTTISLAAPRDGPLVSLLFSEDPSVNYPIPPPPGPVGAPPPPPTGSPPMREYRITSNNARTMLGTIYLPVGRVIIDAGTSVADQSAYTVIVAQQLDLYSGPNLVLNNDYGSTDIPLPDGVGSRVSRKFGLSQ